MCSPVLHKMLCGSFAESNAKRLMLVDVDGEVFGKALDLWCGKVCCKGMGNHEGKDLSSRKNACKPGT
jgi:hypothetical protein